MGSSTLFDGINEATLQLLVNQTPERTYKAIIREGCKLVEADHGSVFLKENRRLSRVYSSHPLLRGVQPRKNGWAEQTLRTGKATVLTLSDREEIHPVVLKIGVRSVIFIPLAYRRKSIGVLSFHSLKQQHFTETELNVLKIFGSLASLAIEKSRSFRDMQRAIEIRDLFISMAAHELRTPLATVHGYAQLLTSHSQKDSIERRWADELQLEANRLTKLVNELLQVSQIRAGKLQYVFKECSFQMILEQARQDFVSLFPERSITIQGRLVKDTIVGDETKLKEVFSHLFSNAAFYSPVSTPIMVRIGNLKNSIRVQIHDKGKGIPSEDMQHIFEGFYKGKGDTAQGMGLGLYEAKQILKSHHGKIMVRSAVHKGTKVIVDLPLYIDDGAVFTP
ncbi:HAMP domain-containing histidine kinase [Candidatus Roizmanbacteria bacterium]|nr:HAMP domain-containing histidine kinase [Candidatus Roizmanbacteria bacterium]